MLRKGNWKRVSVCGERPACASLDPGPATPALPTGQSQASVEPELQLQVSPRPRPLRISAFQEQGFHQSGRAHGGKRCVGRPDAVGRGSGGALQSHKSDSRHACRDLLTPPQPDGAPIGKRASQWRSRLLKLAAVVARLSVQCLHSQIGFQDAQLKLSRAGAGAPPLDAGSNSFRLSLEWSRIVPRKGEVDRSAVDRYHQIFDALDKCATPGTPPH